MVDKTNFSKYIKFPPFGTNTTVNNKNDDAMMPLVTEIVLYCGTPHTYKIWLICKGTLRLLNYV